MDTLFTGQNIIELESVDSTNSHAALCLKTGTLPEGTLILAKEQKAGKGQRGNTWITEAGKNFTGSFVLYPSFLAIEKQFILTKIVSLAVADLLALHLQNNTSIKIKWPNDIYVEGNKIAGILIENSLKQNAISTSIFGIGLNVNQENFGKEAGNATSIKIVSGKDSELKDITKKLCACLEARYLQLRTGKVELINADYLNLLYKINEWRNYSIDNRIVEGKITGVSETGKLKMELKNGVQKEFDLKEIRFI